MNANNLHGEVLEELLELPLSGRISEVPNVQPTPFISTGGSSVIDLRGVRSSAVGSFVDAGRSQVVGDFLDGSRHLDGCRDQDQSQ